MDEKVKKKLESVGKTLRESAGEKVKVSVDSTVKKPAKEATVGL